MTRTSPARVEIGMVIYLHIPGTITLNFTYDPDGIALGVNLNGTDYYYLYNAQGDVIALYDSTGTIVTEYKYDSWGKLLSTTGSGASTIGALNPLRYRGYFYDTDLSLYLLETRYYDPETGRFINADGVLDTRHINASNLYSYCIDDPINLNDSDGGFPVGIVVGAVIGAGIGAISGALSAKRSGRDTRGVLLGALRGGAVGMATGIICSINPSAIGLLATTGRIAGCALVSGLGNLSKQRYDYKHPVNNSDKSNKSSKKKTSTTTKSSKTKAKSTKKVSTKINTGTTSKSKSVAKSQTKSFKDSVDWTEIAAASISGGMVALPSFGMGHLLNKELNNIGWDLAASASSSTIVSFGVAAGDSSISNAIIQLFS